jgi:hypothetical protein
MVRIPCLILFAWSISFASNAQDRNDFYQIEKDLAYHSDIMVNASKSDHRIRAHDDFYRDLKDALDLDASFAYPFDSLYWVSQIAPEDGSFRMFTWQLKHSDDKVIYFGILQMQDGKLIELTDSRPFLSSSEFADFSNDLWYGAIYYEIETYKYRSKPVYLLLGFNLMDSETNIKVAEMMQIEDDRVIFGLPIFHTSEKGSGEVKKRIILEYSDSAVARILMDREKNQINYDHLITIFTEGPGIGPTRVPDGSYEAYEWKKGKWVHIDKLYHQTLEEPLLPNPILEGRKGKDIFGRTRQ